MASQTGMETIPISSLEHDVHSALRRVNKSKRSLMVTVAGKGSAVLMSAEAYRLQTDAKALAKLLDPARRLFAAGKGKSPEKMFKRLKKKYGKAA